MKKRVESGRSILEIIAILALMALITIGGIQVFSMAQSGFVAKDIGEDVMANASVREHALMAKHDANEDKENYEGRHDVVLTVQNGTDGTLKNFFWIEAGNVTTKVCTKLLEREATYQNMKNNFIGMFVGDEKLTNCDDAPIIKFMFNKDPTSNQGPWFQPRPFDGNGNGNENGDENGDEDDEDNGNGEEGNECTRRLCPQGAICSGNVVTCLPGYRKKDCDKCDVSCVKCSGNTYRSSETSSCNDACLECDDGEQPNAAHTDCECLDRGKACDNNKWADGNCECEECIDSSHCPSGEYCDENDCKECETGEVCGSCVAKDEDKPYWDGTKCVSCFSDDECKDNYRCNQSLCEKVCGSHATYNKSGSNKGKCVCKASESYYGAPFEPTGNATTDNAKCVLGHGWDEDIGVYECLDSTHCTEYPKYLCRNHKCVDPCESEEGPCIASCTPQSDGTTILTYKDVTVYENNDPDTHKHCGNPSDENQRGRWVCDVKYRFDSNNKCIGGCDGFTATTCVTKCEAQDDGSADLTYAASGTNCGTNKVCDGRGSCNCKYGKNSSGTCYSCKPNATDGCSGGKICNSAGNACGCAAGKYWNGSSCQNCGARQYSAFGATACSNCAAGKKANTSRTACVSCDAGEACGCDYGANGSGGCRVCRPGTRTGCSGNAGKKCNSAGSACNAACGKSEKCACSYCANGSGGCMSVTDACVASHGGNCNHYEKNGGKTGCWNNGWSVTDRPNGKCTKSGWTFYGRKGSGVCKQYCGSPKTCN